MKHIDIIMSKMSEMIGIDWESIDPKEAEWFKKHSWTESQEAEFSKWLINYLYDNKEAREEILTTGKKVVPKDLIKKEVNWFLLNYGWSLK